MNGSSSPKGWALIPPPLLFALPLALGLFLHYQFPLVNIPDSLAGVFRWCGVVLLALGVLHALPSLVLFILSRTTIIPHRRSSVMVRSWAYRWTRNPMYVGLALIYLGITLLNGAVWPIIFLPLPILVLDRTVIPMEERQMEEAFGAEYAAYRTRVRRWL